MKLGLIAEPWWVNLLVLVPPVAYFRWRRGGVALAPWHLLFSVALLTATKTISRAAAFLWTFAVWDITYYAVLWTTVRWPLSLRDPDVLFLIPRPWISPVWYPLLVSALAILAVLLARATR